MLLQASCITEQKLADQYLAKLPGSLVFIIPQYELFKDNLTVAVDTNAKYTPMQFDSIAWVQSYYIQHLSDSIYLTLFTNSMISELTSQGFNVFISDSSVMFDSLTDPKKVIKIAELLLTEEHGIQYDFEYIIDNEKVTAFGFLGNRVCLNSWLEVIRPDSSEKQVLYLEGCYTDKKVPGFDVEQLIYNTDGQKIRDSVEIVDLYRMADESGRKHAELLLDYLITGYIRENLPGWFTPTMDFYHFDRESKSLVPALDERFDILNEDNRSDFINLYQRYDGPAVDELDGILKLDKINEIIE